MCKFRILNLDPREQIYMLVTTCMHALWWSYWEL